MICLVNFQLFYSLENLAGALNLADDLLKHLVQLIEALFDAVFE